MTNTISNDELMVQLDKYTFPMTSIEFFNICDSLPNINEQQKNIIINHINKTSNQYIKSLHSIDKDKDREFQLSMKQMEISMKNKDNICLDKESDNEKLKIQRLEKEIELTKLKQKYN